MMSKEKIVYKTGGSVTLDKHTHIYQLDTSNGKVVRANMVETGKNTFKLIEFEKCMYMPAASLELAQANFDIVFRHAKYGTLKLSFKEWVAKWLIVFTFKIKQCFKQ